MKIIAHRANIHGPFEQKENTVEAIQQCLDLGYDVEIDVISVNGLVLKIGHDSIVDELVLSDFPHHLHRFWFHAKRIEALSSLLDLKQNHGFKYDVFFHDQDFCTTTANHFIWMYPNPNITRYMGNRYISVLPEQFQLWEHSFMPNFCYGICTDFPNRYKALA